MRFEWRRLAGIGLLIVALAAACGSPGQTPPGGNTPVIATSPPRPADYYGPPRPMVTPQPTATYPAPRR